MMTIPPKWSRGVAALTNTVENVMAYPCGVGDDTWTNGPQLVDNMAGISGASRRCKPFDVRWNGILWRVAWADSGLHKGTLWVLADRDMVNTYKDDLEKLHLQVCRYGGLEGFNGRKPPTLQKVDPAPSKVLALNQLTQAAELALSHGATADDLRLAVYAAMGLDSADPE